MKVATPLACLRCVTIMKYMVRVEVADKYKKYMVRVEVADKYMQPIDQKLDATDWMLMYN